MLNYLEDISSTVVSSVCLYVTNGMLLLDTRAKTQNTASSPPFSHSKDLIVMLSPLPFRRLITFLVATICWLLTGVTAHEVVVETIRPGSGPVVERGNYYRSMVTLYIENADKTRTPSGWSTRKEDGAAEDNPFEFSPGVNLIEGWTQGVVQMKEGERALLHVPSSLGYGPSPMGSPGGAFYIPADSDLLFDIEILGKKGQVEL